MLARQRQFNDGKIDPRYQWLEAIVSKYRVPEAEHEDTGHHHRKTKQKSTARGFMSWMMGAEEAEAEVEALPAGYVREETFEEGETTKQVVARTGLVSTYRTEALATQPFRPSHKHTAQTVARESTGEQLDAELDAILARTLETKPAQE
ncbi:unnamed protein product [Effrenium voratum]|nr:unnamed protein product [Effrenium voratum]